MSKSVRKTATAYKRRRERGDYGEEITTRQPLEESSMGSRLQFPLAFLILAAVAAFPAAAHDDDDDIEIVTLSNRADLISGGDALVEVRVPRRASLSRVEI